MKTQTKTLLILMLLTVLPIFSSLRADSVGKSLEINISIGDGNYDNPMMVLWLEDDNGQFIQTLHIFSKRKIHYDKLKTWEPKSKETEKPEDIDAVSGPTVAWNQSSVISIPAQIGKIDLLSGNYVLCIESRTHIGENYQSLKIPLPDDYKGSVIEDTGSIKSIKITIKDAAN